MSEEIGRGIIRFEGDASGVESSAAKATAATKSFEQAATTAAKNVNSANAEMAHGAEKAASTIDAQAKRFLTTLERQSLIFGKSRSEAAALRAAQLGVAQQAEPFVQRLREAEAAQLKMGITAKQTAAAMRLVPAQMTDIVTSIASGMPIWLVAIQQGGQLKDSFGGIVPTARALLGLITPMKVALFGAAAAIGAVAYGLVKGQAELDNYSRALIFSGNAAGKTVDQLQAMAERVSSLGGTQGAAAEALSQLVAVPRIDTTQLERFAATAVAVNRTTGKAIEETVKEFAALAKDPVKASEQLTEKYNYLTLAVYDQIRALQEQGREAEAVAVAQRAFSDAQAGYAAKAERELRPIAAFWRDIKEAILGAADALLTIGRGKSLEAQIAAARNAIAEKERVIGSFGGLFSNPVNRAVLEQDRARLRVLEEELENKTRQAALEGVAKQNQTAAVEARKANAKWTEKALTDQEKLNKALKEYRDNNAKIAAAGGLLDPKQVAREEAAIRASFDKKGGGGRSTTYRDDAAERMLASLREQAAAMRQQLETGTKLGEAQKALIKFEQEISDLKNKKTLTADQKVLLAREQEIRAQLSLNALYEQELAEQNAIAAVEEKRREAEERFRERSNQIQQSIDNRAVNERERQARELEGLGSGTFNRERIRAENDIRREFQRYQEQLTRNTPQHMLGSEEYAAEVARIQDGLNKALQAHQQYYQQIKAAQGSWQLGMSEAANNYIDTIDNVAKQTEDLFTGAFQRMEDALVNFIRTGKLDFKGFVDFVVGEINRMIIRQMIIKPMIQSMTSGGNPLGAVVGVFGGMFGAGSGIGYGSAGTAAATAMVSNGAGGFVPALAKGGIVGGGKIDMFASGGVVDRPTAFSFGRGKTGVMGEAGYEGVLPLKRTASGHLGVQADGATRSPAVTNVSVTVNARDARSFIDSESQVQASIARAVQRGKRNL